MKLRLICPVIGTGTDTVPFRGVVGDVSLTHSNCLVPSHPLGHPQQGQPKFRFAFCIVGTANLVGVLQVMNSFAFPDYPLDGRLDGMEAVTRAGMVQSLQAFDLDGAGLHLDVGSHNVDANAYRQFLQAIGGQFEPTFSINTFDAQEPTV